jgi:hypothetical protein
MFSSVAGPKITKITKIAPPPDENIVAIVAIVAIYTTILPNSEVFMVSRNKQLDDVQLRYPILRILHRIGPITSGMLSKLLLRQFVFILPGRLNGVLWRMAAERLVRCQRDESEFNPRTPIFWELRSRGRRQLERRKHERQTQ